MRVSGPSENRMAGIRNFQFFRTLH
jgi:hypothetical protein